MRWHLSSLAITCIIIRKREDWEWSFDNRAYRFFDYVKDLETDSS